MYQPPFEITSRIIELISKISEKIGEINSLQNSPYNIQLRKENRIKTIHSSLAIENNSLTLEQITAIIEGKRVLGNPNEIKEVKNSIQAYDLLLSLNPYNEKDLLNAHKLMMQDLVNVSGKYRTDSVGIFNGEKVVHVAPPAKRVPELMADLFEWLKNSDAHPLIKSCVFHYEFEFIHPFQDGNGRMGRLWQTVILKDWKEIFAWIPVETLIKENQKDYYNVLGVNDSVANSTKFIEFMLDLILNTIDEIIKNEQKVTVKVTQKVTANQEKIIEAIKTNPFITQEELVELGEEDAKEYLEELGISDSGIDRMIKSVYKLLNLITFITAGEKEIHAWTCSADTKAPQAAGVIHTDFEKGFIRAEVTSYKDFVECGSYTACKDKGVTRLEGKDYIVQDGDIVHFRFAV